MDNFRENWKSWAAAAIFLCISMAALYGFKATRDLLPAFCAAKDDGDCGRQWISAAGAWVAIIAAYFTIREMSLQRREAIQHQRDNVEIEIMGRLALCRRVRREAYYPYLYCERAKERFATARSIEIEYECKEFMLFAKRVKEPLCNAVFGEFEDKIGFIDIRTPLSLVKQVEAVELSIERYRELSLDPIPNLVELNGFEPSLTWQFESCYGACESFFAEVRKDALTFESKWQRKIS